MGPQVTLLDCTVRYWAVLGCTGLYQSGRKCGVCSQRTCSHFFWLLVRILTIFDEKYRILTRRDKRESCLIVLQQNNV